MRTVSSLLDQKWYERYKKISKLNIRSSIYDVTNRCNLRCKGCFFFSSDEDKAAPEETDIRKWEAFIDREKERQLSEFSEQRHRVDASDEIATAA